MPLIAMAPTPGNTFAPGLFLYPCKGCIAGRLIREQGLLHQADSAIVPFNKAAKYKNAHRCRFDDDQEGKTWRIVKNRISEKIWQIRVPGDRLK
jgi:hypothetical protein